jgi:hypothetical protein
LSNYLGSERTASRYTCRQPHKVGKRKFAQIPERRIDLAFD